jgi:hypothetical protein
MAGKIKDLALGLYATVFGPVYGTPDATVGIGQGYDEIIKGIKSAVGTDKVQIAGVYESGKSMPWGNQFPEEPISVEDAFDLMLAKKLDRYQADARLTAVNVFPAIFGRKDRGFAISGECELTDGFPLPRAIVLEVYPVSEESPE